MTCRLIDGVKYIGLMNDNEFKSKSLEDNVYFTLRDILLNAHMNHCITANYFNDLLTNNISFEERDKNFNYQNVLYDYNSDYTQTLYIWIGIICENKDDMFDFYEPKKIDKDDNPNQKYIKYDEWWEQLLDLREKLFQQLEKHMKWKADDVCDRIAELDDDEI